MHYVERRIGTMKLPYDILSQNYIKPKLYLCETNKQKICELETISMSGVFKFNAYSELSFTIPRVSMNMVTGQTDINPYYNKIEALRLVYLDGFGYFEIQDPEIVSDGIREVKNVTAYSLEYNLSQKYLEDFNVNTGENDSIEVIYANGGAIVPVTLYNEHDHGLSLLNLILEKIYSWRIGHVDESLKNLGRTFEISRTSVYDFIIQDICEKFNCFAVFDTINNTINLYAEALSQKFIGDGSSTVFTLTSPYYVLGSVTINSYKTTAYTYNFETGVIIFDEPPANGSIIEIIDGSQEQWTTDVYVSFDNLAQEVNISYSADAIKTVLTVKGADDLDIREVNMGLPYLVDLSYYHSIDWMGQDLYDAYTSYLQSCSAGQKEYQDNSTRIQFLNDYIDYEKNRLSLQYSIADNVTETTVGTYYVRGGTYPDYYYSEVKLPNDWKAGIVYYTLSGNDLDEEKFSKLYEALQKYYKSQDEKDVSGITELADDFRFMDVHTIDDLASILESSNSLSEKDEAVLAFLDEMWGQIGLTPLDTLYYKPYNTIKTTNEEAGWNDTSNSNYWNYYPVTIIIESLEREIDTRKEIIQGYQNEQNDLYSRNTEITDAALIDKHFSYDHLVRLSAFLREDEYTDDSFVETEIDTIETRMQTKKELMECGRIELQKLCAPKLEFSMDMANIYALTEFAPMINQFQLGNLINVVIRSDYIKRARLLEVDINFDDFSDFSCEFGELTSLRTQSSIHADLLSTALTAGKSVASNASYWSKTSDVTTSLNLLIQQGLLDANTVIKSIAGTQGVSMDQYGIHLQKFDESTGALDPKEGWIVNNQFLYSSDNFKTTESVFGEYTVDGQTYWGLLAKAIMAGYIAGSKIHGSEIYGSSIEGGTINIGDGTFIVDENGSVTMNSKGNMIDGYVTTEDMSDLSDRVGTAESSITQNANNISTKVSKGEIISEINQSAEEAKIKADKIKLEGFVSINGNFCIDKNGNMDAIGGSVGGFDIGETSLSCDITEDFNSITSDDVAKIRDVVLGDATLSDSEFERLDINGDYHIGATDMLYARMISTGNMEKTAESRMSINLNSARDAILIEGLSGAKEGYKTRIGVGGISTRSIKADNLICGDYELSNFVVSQGESGIWKYRKWNDGTIECWGTYEYEFGNGSLNGYAYTWSLYVDLPMDVFSSAPTCGVANTNCLCTASYWEQNSSSEQARIVLSSGYQYTTANACKIYMHFIGS